MIIDSGTIGMESGRTYRSVSREARFTCLTDSLGGVTDFLSIAEGAGSTADAGLLRETGDQAAGYVTAQLEEAPESSGDASELLKELYDRLQVRDTPRVRRLMEENMLSKIREETLKYLLRLVGGYDCGKTKGSEAIAAGAGGLEGGVQGLSGSIPGAGGLYRTTGRFTVDYETETTVFSTVGTVKTADGRSIDFNIEAAMSREFMSFSGFRVQESVMLTDPLVINLDGSPAEVTDKKFYFDIDSDGTKEYVSMPSSGKGMLALDLNGDGRINDGSELFGTRSGDAFADLAEYDQDGNGWIDEADDIFDRLRVWSIDEDGERLISLKECGIGAICLNSVQTEFSLNDALTNETDAVIRSTGMFLFENGEAGTMQQLDLAFGRA